MRNQREGERERSREIKKEKRWKAKVRKAKMNPVSLCLCILHDYHLYEAISGLFTMPEGLDENLESNLNGITK